MLLISINADRISYSADSSFSRRSLIFDVAVNLTPFWRYSSLNRHGFLCLTDNKFSDCISISLATTSSVKILLVLPFARFKFTNKSLIDFNIYESLFGSDELLVLLVKVEISCVVVIGGVASHLLSTIFPFIDLSSIDDSVFLVSFNSFKMYSLIFFFFT